MAVLPWVSTVKAEPDAGGVDVVADADVEDGVGDVKLGGGTGAAQGVEGVGAGEGVEDGGQDVVGGVGVERAAGGALVLGEREEDGGVADGVEGEDGVEFGQTEVGGDLGSERGAGGLLGEELGVDGWGLAGLLRGGLAERSGVALLPFPGGVEVDEVERDELFGAGALCGVIDDVGTGDAVVGDELEGAIVQDEVDAVGGLIGRGKGGDVLGGGGAGGREDEPGQDARDICAGAGPFCGLVRLLHHRILIMVPV